MTLLWEYDDGQFDSAWEVRGVSYEVLLFFFLCKE